MTRLLTEVELAEWDSGFVERAVGMVRPVAKKWFRSEIRGLDRLPDGAALVVGNHSGGLMTMDVPIFAVDFYEQFGYQRRLYTLSHDMLFRGSVGDLLIRTGFIPAHRNNAVAALHAGGVVIAFPGGDYDVYRPFTAANKIDFNGRKGYVRTAVDAGVPIVPAVTIGGQESQLFLVRGHGLAKALRLDKLVRTDVVPVSFGFPFGFSIGLPPNFPMPTKIITEVLDPIDVVEEFGNDPDVAAVDVYVRTLMQEALDRLAAKRRFPILG